MVWPKVIPVGKLAGAEGVMLALSDPPALAELAVYPTLNGLAELSTNPWGYAMVTIRPVGSTLGLTVGSLDTRLNTVSEG